MIKQIKFENYRCFEKMTVSFKELVIVVGRNNVGKSTMIEALRMVSFATHKAENTSYRDVPLELEMGKGIKGIRIDVERLKIGLKGIVSYYEDKIAMVEVRFDNQCKIIIKANTEVAYAVLFDEDGRYVKTKNKAKECSFNKMAILPQIGLIKENEKKLLEDTVVRDQETYLSSRHFRNELLLYKEQYWDEFKMLAESSWDGLEITALEYDPFSLEEEYIQLILRDKQFPAEVGLMGNGLQMWLQIIWFICRSRDSETIILDEPDVYMHPDLQIKLLRMVENMHKQIIIATHSVEIISEVSSKHILLVDKDSQGRKAQYANGTKAVQSIIDNMGGIQNLAVIRIGMHKKCLFVEGKDKKILSQLYEKLYPLQNNLFDTLPVVELHGFSNVNETFGTADLFYAESKGDVKCVCILDSDYYHEDYLHAIKEQAKEHHLLLHIWKKKEIENYLIIPEVWYRMLDLADLSYDGFLEVLDELANEFKDVVTDQIAEKYWLQNRDKGLAKCNEYARAVINLKWKDMNSKLSLISGKEFISRFNRWSQKEYNVRISNVRILEEMRIEEIGDEIKDVMEILQQL